MHKEIVHAKTILFTCVPENGPPTQVFMIVKTNGLSNGDVCESDLVAPSAQLAKNGHPCIEVRWSL